MSEMIAVEGSVGEERAVASPDSCLNRTGQDDEYVLIVGDDADVTITTQDTERRVVGAAVVHLPRCR